MDQQVTIEGIDALLIPYLCATDELLSEKLLGQLIYEHAGPVINKIIKHKLRVSLDATQGNLQNQDGLEIAGELRLILLSELRALKDNQDHRPIGNFLSFVAIKTYSACADYFREKNPQRWRLKNTLRHQLKQNPLYALWKREENNRWYAGLSDWRERESADEERAPQPLSLNVTAEKLAARLPREDIKRLPPDELLSVIFELAEHAIEFDRVVALAAEAWGIKDQAVESFENEDGELTNELADASQRIDLIVEHRSYLAKLWAEVSQLPALQRAALLLNLRDAEGSGVIAFIPHLGIASRSEIARMLGMTEERFGALWNDLPLDDTRIAGLLGLTRQQVINLRKTARERLARRMKGLEKSAESSLRSGKNRH
jgi:CRP-like cAMP-binding protein